MAIDARLRLSLRRNEARAFVIRVRGIAAAQLEAAAPRMQVRDAVDAPGAPRINLALTGDAAALGLRIVAQAAVAGVPECLLLVQFDKATASSAEALPYGPSGQSRLMAYGLQWNGRTRLQGELEVLGSAIDSDAAPISRELSSGTGAGTSTIEAGATVTIASDEIIELVLDGAGELVGLLAGVDTAVAEAKAARDAALAVAGDVPAIKGRLGALSDQALTTHGLGASTDYTFVGCRAIAYMLAAGADLPVGNALAEIGGPLQIDAGTTRIQARIWQRALNSPNLASYPGAAGDELVQTISVTPTAAGIEPGGPFALVSLQLPAPLLIASGFGYVVEIVAFDATSTVKRVGWRLGSGAGLPPERRGWISINGATQAIDANSRWGWQVKIAPTIGGVAGEALATSRAADTAAKGLRQTVGVLTGEADQGAALAGLSDFTAGGARALGYLLAAGTDLSVGMTLKGLGGVAQADASAASVQLRLYRRALTSANLNAYPGAADDVLVQTVTVSLAAAGLTAGGGFAAFSVPLTTPVPIEDGASYVALFTMLNAAGAAVRIGWRFLPAAAGSAANRRGWVDVGAGGQAIGATDRWGWSALLGATVVSLAKEALATARAGTTTMVRAVRSLCPGVGMEGLRMIPSFASAGFDNTTPKTFQAMIETAQAFDAIRLVLTNPGAVPIAVGKAVASVRADTNPVDNNNGAAWVGVTFGGSATGVIPARGGNFRAGYLVSDWIPLSSIPRTDGRKGGVLMARAYLSTAANNLGVNLMEDAAALAARTNGYAFGVRQQDGDAATTIANFASTASGTVSPIVGVQYSARGLVVNLGANGDSITEALTDAIRGDGFVVRLARAMHNADGIAWEAANLGWSGSTTTSFRERFEDFTAAGLRADIMMWCGGSPNDIGSGANPLTPAAIATFRQNRQRACTQMRALRTVPFLWTYGPYGSGFYDLNGSDALRVADNAEIMAMRGRGVLVADIAAALAGATDADGQQQPNAARLADPVHPNAVGYDAMKAVAETDLRNALGNPT